jgi:hypothetical protein
MLRRGGDLWPFFLGPESHVAGGIIRSNEALTRRLVIRSLSCGSFPHPRSRELIPSPRAPLRGSGLCRRAGGRRKPSINGDARSRTEGRRASGRCRSLHAGIGTPAGGATGHFSRRGRSASRGRACRDDACPRSPEAASARQETTKARK